VSLVVGRLARAALVEAGVAVTVALQAWEPPDRDSEAEAPSVHTEVAGVAADPTEPTPRAPGLAMEATD